MGCCTEEHGAQHQSDRFELRVSLESFDFFEFLCVCPYIAEPFLKRISGNNRVCLSFKDGQMPALYCHGAEGDRPWAGTWLCSNTEWGGGFEVVTSDRHALRVCSFPWGLGVEADGGNLRCVETNHRKMVLWHGARRWHYNEALRFWMLGLWKQSPGKSQESFLNGVVVRPSRLLSPR